MPRRARRKTRVTMNDIAVKVGCSQSTVSFVLNENRSVSISEETRARVINAARELGYNLNQTQVLSGRPSKSSKLRRIAFLIDSFATTPEGVSAVRGALDALNGTGIVLVTYEIGSQPQQVPEIMVQLISDGVEGIIFGCIYTREVEVPKELVESGIPYVLMNCTSRGCDAPSVVPSEIAGGHRATLVLIEAGHRVIGTIMGEEFFDPAQDRLKGYRRALATEDIPFSPRLVVKGDWSPSSGYQGTKQLMELTQRPTAIFCQNDRMAIGCYEFLKENGFRIPQDVSVIGYDDEEIASHLSPPLTTLNLPSAEMGEWAVDTLLHWNAEQGAELKLECELIERQSIAPPSTALRKNTSE